MGNQLRANGMIEMDIKYKNVNLQFVTFIKDRVIAINNKTLEQ